VDWQAPLADGPVDATVRLPGSKSVTNRALVLGALAAGVTELVDPLDSRDTRLMAAGLRVLGVPVQAGPGRWAVTGQEPPLAANGDLVDVGNAGTVARFLPPVAALAGRSVLFDGDPRVRERPVGGLVEGLRQLGVRVTDSGGRLPLQTHGTGRVPGGTATIDASQSSQQVSGLLLAGTRFEGGLDLHHVGAPLPSRPHVLLTVALLQRAGAQVQMEGDHWLVAPGQLRGGRIRIEPDLSNAAPFLAAAMLTGGRVRVPHWPLSTAQPGGLLPGLLGRLGAEYTLTDDGLTLTGRGQVNAFELDLSTCGELAPVFAALAALADGPSRLSGIGHLRLHESDRLAALQAELGELGADVQQLADGLAIRPGRLRGRRFHTYDDHRLAMAAAVLGLVVPGLVVENVEATAKTLPDFVDRWTRMLDSSERAAGTRA
jgi:3-phosphoshikimate 1-carboxyvinyltransferase